MLRAIQFLSFCSYVYSFPHLAFCYVHEIYDKVLVKASEVEEHGGSVVECLIPDRGVAGSSLTGGNALCP